MQGWYFVVKGRFVTVWDLLHDKSAASPSHPILESCMGFLRMLGLAAGEAGFHLQQAFGFKARFVGEVESADLMNLAGCLERALGVALLPAYEF